MKTGIISVTSVSISNSVTEIFAEAFSGCDMLNEIHIRNEHPSSMRIHEAAFRESIFENCILT